MKPDPQQEIAALKREIADLRAELKALRLEPRTVNHYHYQTPIYPTYPICPTYPTSPGIYPQWSGSGAAAEIDVTILGRN